MPFLIAALGRLLTLCLENKLVLYLPESIVELTGLQELVLQGNHIAVLNDNWQALPGWLEENQGQPTDSAPL